MRVFSEAAVLEKNRLASDSPFLIFLEIENKEIGVIRLVRNTENIMWQGNEWQAFPLDIETSSEDGKTIPALNVKVSNCGGIIQTYLQQYNGLVDSMVRLMVALASNLENPNPEFELDFLIKSASYDESWVTFCLSASAELMNRFPPHPPSLHQQLLPVPMRRPAVRLYRCGGMRQHAGNLPHSVALRRRAGHTERTMNNVCIQ